MSCTASILCKNEHGEQHAVDCANYKESQVQREILKERYCGFEFWWANWKTVCVHKGWQVLRGSSVLICLFFFWLWQFRGKIKLQQDNCHCVKISLALIIYRWGWQNSLKWPKYFLASIVATPGSSDKQTVIPASCLHLWAGRASSPQSWRHRILVYRSLEDQSFWVWSLPDRVFLCSSIGRV